MNRIACLFAASLMLAQDAKVRFEEASIKPGDPNALGGTTNSDPGRFSAVNVTLKRLIGRAYDIEPYQIEGGPKWMDSDRFTIAAKLNDDDSAKSRSREERGRLTRAALQSMLEERFHMSGHRESKVMPCLALVVARGGTKIHEVEPKGGGTWSQNPGMLTAKGMSMPDMAARMASAVQRPVVDQTGLKGVYDLKLEWSPESASPDAKTELPSIFAALQEQLGLKLETTKAPIEVLIIDRAAKPSEN